MSSTGSLVNQQIIARGNRKLLPMFSNLRLLSMWSILIIKDKGRWKPLLYEIFNFRLNINNIQMVDISPQLCMML